jgi:Cu+-exporting ATPase
LPIAARAVAAQVGIDEVLSDVAPDGKVDAIARLQRAGRAVAMVGDGLNDAPALAQADLGVAVGTGTDVAKQASDLTLASGDLRATADAIRLARGRYGPFTPTCCGPASTTWWPFRWPLAVG